MENESWLPILTDYDIMDSYMGDGSTFFYDTAIPESTRCKLRENFEMAIHKFEGMMFPGDNELLLSSFPAGPPGCNSFYNDYSCPKLSLESTCLPNFAIEAPIGSSMTPIYPNIVQNAASSSCDGSEFSFVRPDEIFSHSTSPASMGLLFRDDSIDTDLDNFHTFQDPDASSPLSHASPLTSSSMPSECLEPASYDKYCPQPFPEVKLERGVSPISPGALRSQKDRFLVQARDSNMTYKEIKERGGFSEAESTLRGRYRALTKEKEARVRKPAWSHVDITLLKEGVNHYAAGESVRRAKLPWKKIAEYIEDNGGTYLFGPATCKKKWTSLFSKRSRD